MAWHFSSDSATALSAATGVGSLPTCAAFGLGKEKSLDYPLEGIVSVAGALEETLVSKKNGTAGYSMELGSSVVILDYAGIYPCQ